MVSIREAFERQRRRELAVAEILGLDPSRVIEGTLHTDTRNLGRRVSWSEWHGQQPIRWERELTSAEIQDIRELT